MSLTIKLDRVYLPGKNQSNQFSETINERIRSLVSKFKNDSEIVDCQCEVKFRESSQLRSLTWQTISINQKRNSLANIKKQNNDCDSDEDDEEDDAPNLRDNFLRRLVPESTRNKSVVFVLASHVDAKDTLEIQCFKISHPKKPFGKYKMLLESIKDGPNTLRIDDFLINPKTNNLLPEKISFSIKHIPPVINTQTGRITKYSIRRNPSLSDVLDVRRAVMNLEEKKFMNRSMSRSTSRISTGGGGGRQLIGGGGKRVVQHESFNYVQSNNKLAEAIGKATLTMAQITYNPSLIINDDAENGKKSKEGSKKTNYDDSVLSRLGHLENFRLDEYSDKTKCLVPYLLTKNLNNKLHTWQVKVNLIELKFILGTDEDVFCVVEIGPYRFQSRTKHIDRLKFNEVFTSKFENVRSQKFFNYLVKISVYYKYFFKPNILLGTFTMDFGTVYKQPNCEFYHKWGAIMPSEDSAMSVGSSGGLYSFAMSAPRGYIKLDCIVLSKGVKAQIHKEELDKDDDIDTNLILPYGLERPRMLIELKVTIYSADVLIKHKITSLERLRNNIMNTKKSLMDGLSGDESPNTSMTHTILNMIPTPSNPPRPGQDPLASENLDMNNLFVQISFSGVTRRTTAISYTSTPSWNETFKFVFLFPNLVRLFKIDLCHESRFGLVSILASEYLDMDSISDYSLRDYFLPTLGPSFIDMYSDPANLRVRTMDQAEENASDYEDEDDDDDLDENKDRTPVQKRTTRVRSYPTISGSKPGGGEYVARLLISINAAKADSAKNKNDELTQSKKQSVNNLIRQCSKSFTLFGMISECVLQDSRYQGDLSFQICMGTHGYSNINSLSSKDLPANFTQEQPPIQLGDNMPCYLPFEKQKPCISLEVYIEDVTYRIYTQNFLRRAMKSLGKICTRLFGKHSNESDFRKFLKHLLQIQKYLQEIYINDALITEIEKNRSLQINLELKNIIDVIQTFDSMVDEKFKRVISNMLMDSIDKIKVFCDEPLSSFPDINLWLLCDKQPIGICTLRACDIIWSKTYYQRGNACGKLVYTDIKTLNQKDYENPLYENIARIRCYMWFGLSKDVQHALDGLQGHKYSLSENFMNHLRLPTFTFTSEKLTFELRCHLYQGRDLLGLDSTGLSDPYTIVTIANRSIKSKVMAQTNNPLWKSTLIISEIYLYSNYEFIEANPPEIIVDLYDQDMIGADEFMGRCYVKPLVQKIALKPPRLRWYQVFQGHERAGDILASFELILTNDDSNRRINRPPTLQRENSIPRSIMPRMSPYYLEILFWGMRNIKLNQSVFYSKDKLKICIQIGDSYFESNLVDIKFSNDNFLVVHKRQPISLPEETEYKPHLNIKCIAENSLKKQRIIGSYTVKTINDYFRSTDELVKSYKEYAETKTNKEFSRQLSVINQSEEIEASNEFWPNKKMSEKQKSEKKYSKMVKKLHKKSEHDHGLEYLDWWSKYYASLSNDEDAAVLSQHVPSQDEKQASATSSYIINYGDENNRGEEEEEEENDEFGEDEEDEEDNSEDKAKSTKVQVKKKIKKIHKKRQRKRAIIRNRIRQRLNLPKKDLSVKKPKPSLSEEVLVTERKRAIERIEIFDCELEKQFENSFKMLETYPLYVGKHGHQTSQESVQCNFKGNFLLYKEDEVLRENFERTVLKRYGGFLRLVPPNTPVQVKVRIYVIKANILPIREGGLCDPYLSIKLGDRNIDDSANTRHNTLTPIFGCAYEYDVRFPYESQLKISVKDWFNKGLIGRTVIDLENRYYSNCYAMCGLPKKYETSGYNQWRDLLTPSQVLEKLCRQWRLKKPEFSMINYTLKITKLDETIKEYKLESDLSDTSEDSDPDLATMKKFPEQAAADFELVAKEVKNIKEDLALMALNDWQNITGTQLVPEHVETRSLYNPEIPGFEQGKLTLWIDMFPLDDSSTHLNLSSLPKLIDVTPRKPKKFQLRVIIYNTEDVILDDVNPLTGEKTSDIYVKAFLCDRIEDAQKTDVHYRSLNGEGNFNWRFVFDFEYLPAEDKIVYKKKEGLFSLVAMEHRMEPFITLQCWDADLISSDDHLGSIQLNLSNMVRGVKLSKNCKASMLRTKSRPRMNLFKTKSHKGWWPFVTIDSHQNLKLTGKLEAEFTLLSEEQALERPAGRGRDEPDPLPAPNRPKDSFLWFSAPLRTFRYVIWKNYKLAIIQGVVLILFIIFILIFIYQLPSKILEKVAAKIG